MKRKTRSGAVIPLVAISLVVLGGFAAFGIDLGYMYSKQAQLQSAADAGALAGASTIISAGNDLVQIRTSALTFARRNLTDDDSPTAAVTAADVTFFRDGAPNNANPNEVEVFVRRGGDRGKPGKLAGSRSRAACPSRSSRMGPSPAKTALTPGWARATSGRAHSNTWGPFSGLSRPRNRTTGARGAPPAPLASASGTATAFARSVRRAGGMPADS